MSSINSGVKDFGSRISLISLPIYGLRPRLYVKY